jgi:hypothetical protein
VIKDTVKFTDDNPSGSANVVTVRNRWDVVLGVPLSVVVSAVLKEMPTITCFYCAFCRANRASRLSTTADAAARTQGV